MGVKIRRVIKLTGKAAGTFLLTFLFLLFGSNFVHILSGHLQLEDGYRWAGFGERHGPGGTVMWICGGDPSVDWRTLPLYALLYFAICWQIAKLESSRLAPGACLLGICLVEYSRLSSLRYLAGELENNPQLADYLTLECAYLLCALTAVVLGAWLAPPQKPGIRRGSRLIFDKPRPHPRRGLRPSPSSSGVNAPCASTPGSESSANVSGEAMCYRRLVAAVGWTGGVAFLVPVPYLMVQKILSPVPQGILVLWMTFALTSFLFVHAFVRRRSIRGLAWLWLASIFTTLAALEL